MAQHFLLSAKARTLSLKAIYAGGEDKAYDTFRKFRWPQTDGEPVCPRCGSVDAYALATRRQFSCSACRHRFSLRWRSITTYLICDPSGARETTARRSFRFKFVASTTVSNPCSTLAFTTAWSAANT